MRFESIKRGFFWMSDFFHGSHVRYFYNDLVKVNKDCKNGSIIQQQHLKNILDYAVSNSSFYKSMLSGKDITISNFTVTNKTILTDNYDDICIPIKLIPGQEEETVHIQKTSGSTGTPFSIPQDTRKRKRRLAELKYYNNEVGVKSHEMIGQCRIWTKWQSKSKWQSFKENIIPINVSTMDDETCEKLFHIVRKSHVVLIRAYASWYDAIVRYIEEGKGNTSDLKSLRVCLSSSEALNDETRKKMMDLTGVPIVETYANEEAGVLAQQKIGDNNYYLNHSGYFFEFLKLDEDIPAEPGELSRIVITDLFNYAFPLIRYDTGDTAIYSEGNDNSYGWKYINNLYGRRLDLIYNTDGIPVSPMCFPRIIKNFSGIVQWQFVQKDRKEYIVRLNLTSDVSVEDVKEKIKEVVGDDAIVSVEYVEDIPVLASGKRKPVVCEWKR